MRYANSAPIANSLIRLDLCMCGGLVRRLLMQGMHHVSYACTLTEMLCASAPVHGCTPCTAAHRVHRCRQPQWSRGVCVRHAPNPCTRTLGRDRWGGTPLAPLGGMTNFLTHVYQALMLFLVFSILRELHSTLPLIVRLLIK